MGTREEARKRMCIKALKVLIPFAVIWLLICVLNDNRINKNLYVSNRPTGSSHKTLVEEYKNECREAIAEKYGAIIDDYLLCADSARGYGMDYYFVTDKIKCYKVEVDCPYEVWMHILHGGNLPDETRAPKLELEEGFFAKYLTNQ